MLILGQKLLYILVFLFHTFAIIAFLSQMKDNAIIHKITSNLVEINTFKIQFWGKNTYIFDHFWSILATKILILHSIFFKNF